YGMYFVIQYDIENEDNTIAISNYANQNHEVCDVSVRYEGQKVYEARIEFDQLKNRNFFSYQFMCEISVKKNGTRYNYRVYDYSDENCNVYFDYFGFAYRQYFSITRTSENKTYTYKDITKVFPA
ncbi:MAG: hypothetical protein HUJ61_03310, partial [Bacilli bacterium]|nr:hypothetical protein [Bacilli bacterium]